MRGTPLHALALIALGLLPARAALAQDTAPPPPAEPPPAAQAEGSADASGSAIGGSVEAGAQADVAPPAPEPEPEIAPQMPPVPPIMVAAIATGRVPPETLDAVRAALLAQVEPMAGGRPVLPLLAPELIASISACSDAPCLGAQIAGAGAIGAIVARLSRRAARGPVEVRIEMVDPVSGAARTPPIVYSLTAEGPAIGEALAPLIQQLRAAMFSPPPPPPQILVTVNVDGATVRIDDEPIGESPVAARVVTPGTHVIMVTRAGYSGVRREVDVDLGENERIDITLSEAIGGIEGGGEGGSAVAEPEWYENWLVWLGIGGGVVVVALVIGISVGVVTSQPQTVPDPMGIPLPPLQ